MVNMVNSNQPNKTRLRPGLFSGQKLPHLSLNLHIMPQTSTGHFKKWLVLGMVVFGIIIIIALILFSL
ncbi:MAG: hypothetical protein WC523_05385 [Patescibacteria group bacterium]|jgi:hypothetical protein